MEFDPKNHMLKLKGKDYLPVAARLLWLNHDTADYTIRTEHVALEETHAIFRATVTVRVGEYERTAIAHKREDKQHFPDFTEKAETGSIGRALGMLGFGTQFAPEFDESDTLPTEPTPRGEPRIVDTPQKTQPKQEATISQTPIARGDPLLESLEAKARYVIEQNPETAKQKSTTYPGAASILAACKAGLYRRPTETAERRTAFEQELIIALKAAGGS